MLTRVFPLPVKFFCSIIFGESSIYEKVKTILSRKFGAIDFESEVFDFDFTDYYYKEMGKPLFRRFVSFKALQDQGKFASIKLFAIKIEKKFSRENRRLVNIDPGYITEAKLVLTTTKDFCHRIYIGKGVWAEVTMQYRDGAFQNSPTTYPDYRTAQYKQIFLTMRDTYRQQIKNAERS
ncbi:MAG: DUF4416 family protein [Candidatus Omnitrophica bacterium]|nr:DUF4416 family protein [Candidatus Omnitrophota bacterium]